MLIEFQYLKTNEKVQLPSFHKILIKQSYHYCHREKHEKWLILDVGKKSIVWFLTQLFFSRLTSIQTFQDIVLPSFLMQMTRMISWWSFRIQQITFQHDLLASFLIARMFDIILQGKIRSGSVLFIVSFVQSFSLNIHFTVAPGCHSICYLFQNTASLQ